jgi:SAM-dependent methyltransferase
MTESNILKEFLDKQRRRLKQGVQEVIQGIRGKPVPSSSYDEYLSRRDKDKRESPSNPLSLKNVRVFEENVKEYDDWFERYPAVFESELAALRELVPLEGRGVEIGAGTGRFSPRLGIKVGVEPSPAMGAIARTRGLEVHQGLAEDLPFEDGSFDFSLLVTVLCFVDNPLGALREIHRILRPEGLLVTAFIDRESRLARSGKSSGSKFLGGAFLYSAREMMDLLERSGFQWREARQTLFSPHETMTAPDKPKPGFGEGNFIVFSAARRK